MRILHVTTEFPPIVFGGLGTAVGGLVRAISRTETEVAVLLVGGILPPEEYGRAGRLGGLVQVEDINAKVTFFQIPPTAPVEAAREIAEEWRPDLIHLHTAWIWPFVVPLLALRVPMVYTVHSVDRAEYEIGGEPEHILEHSDNQGRAIEAADRLIALTADENALLGHFYPGSCARVRIVGNGIDDSGDARRACLRDREGEALLVLYAGRLVERKGIRELLRAAARVLAALPDVLFVLAGGPPGYPGEELARAWLPEECHPFRERIHFTGWLDLDELAGWYRRAHVQVIPSRYEPFGMVVLEGMIHGLAIVATDVGGPAAILDDGRTALLVPPGNSDALGDALFRVLASRDLRADLGLAAAYEVRRSWLWDRIAARMLGVYREVVADRADPLRISLHRGDLMAPPEPVATRA